ncbi:MAG: hypothetical protein AAFQ53_08430 [Bacteroidota bacterium]
MKMPRSAFAVLALAVLTVATAPGAAAQSEELCAPGQTYVYFVNGVNTTRPEARSAAIALRDNMLTSRADDVEDFQWGYAYNQTGRDVLPGGTLLDFLQAIQQWDDDFTVSVYRWIAGIEAAPDWFRDAYLDYITAIDAANYVRDRDLAAFVDRFSQLIDQGNRVLLVPHSQGNFYANQAHRLIQDDALSILGVASPASLVEGGGSYVSLQGDLVVEGTPRALPPNVANPTRGDLANHGFLTSYLAGPNSLSLLTTRFESTAAATPFPDADLGSGIITVRLTWGSEPDLDLHAFEPNGAHVYYANRQGPSGFLDRDDVTSFGPEHYYVSCATLEEGLYTFGVNYFSGSGPETAELLVTGGNTTRRYTEQLTTPRGVSGNDSPVILSQIEVIQEDSGAYSFDVRASSSPVQPGPGEGVAPSPLGGSKGFMKQYLNSKLN